MSYRKPILGYHSHADIIWPDGTLLTRIIENMFHFYLILRFKKKFDDVLDEVLHGWKPLSHGEAQPSHAQHVGQQAVPVQSSHSNFSLNSFLQEAPWMTWFKTIGVIFLDKRAKYHPIHPYFCRAWT
jgi:hypothetical protein